MYSEEEVIEEVIEEGLEEKTSPMKEIFSWVMTMLFAAVFALLLTQFVILNATVPSGSMEETIRTNDRILAFRLSYLFSSPGRFDIVVFPSPDNGVLNVKRVIGLPGETIHIVDGRVFVDGSDAHLRDDFVKGPFMGNWGPYTVPEGHLFMLGDYRSNSQDSRRWNNPFVYEGDVMGRVFIRYWPGIRLLHNT